jgi:O-antigen/teichoic acid export membrane protein
VRSGDRTAADAAPDAAAVSSRRRAALSPRALISAASWMSGANLVAQAFSYCSLIVLASILPPDSFGTVATGTAIIWVACTLVGAGTVGGVIVSRRLTYASLRNAFWQCLLAAGLLAVAMAVGAHWFVGAVAHGGDASALAALSLALPLYAVALIPMALLQREMEFGKLAGVTAGSNVGAAAVGVVAGLAGAGVWALVARQLLWFTLLAALAVAIARPYLPSRYRGLGPKDETESRPVGNRWFLLFATTLLLGMNVDYLVIGGVSNVGAVGLYAVAFLIAFAPLLQFSSEIGKVLFAAAAASDLAASGARTVQAVRLMSIIMLPLLPVAIVLAPPLLPAILGDEWHAMVAPFQILLIVGIGQAIVNFIGEALSGLGQIAFRAKINVAWCVATIAALLVLVPADGIRGAAFAHLAVFLPYAAVYATVGARRAGTSARELWHAISPIVLAVGWQSAATAAVAVGLNAAGAAEGVAAGAAAAVGLSLSAVLLIHEQSRPAREAVTLLRGAFESRG